jgi:cytoskeletal protein RodZ
MVMSGEYTDPRVEPGIGRSLEEARQSKGLSLREVEQRTRIRSRYLRDLEREDFDVLPAVYVLGSLKTYADFLGLDGAALSGQLKARLTEPDEPEAHAAVPADVYADERDDEYEAAPVPAVGFDQLFLGMGVILISILAIMTLATAVAQGDRSPVSQVDQPSTPESPSEVALAGNTREEEGGEVGAPENGALRSGEDPEASKVSGDDEQDASGGDEDRDASRTNSPFGDAEFVPMSPSSGSTGTSSTASASSAASASAGAASAETEDRPSSPRSSPASATSETSPRPAADNQAASAPAPPSNAPAPARPQGAGQPSRPASGAGPIPAEAARVMGETFRLNGP